ncbi:MAG: type IV pilus modification PilV family protein [Minisyncoccia bacterium]
MPQFKLFKVKKGFSLIEVLIAISLLAIILVLILPIWQFELINKRISNLNIANRIAASKLEELKQAKFSGLPELGTTTFSHPDLAKLNQGSGLIFVENYSTSSLKKITIEVLWQDNQTSTYKINYIFNKNE